MEECTEMGSMPCEPIVVLATAGRAEAEVIARTLASEGYAACVNVIDAISFYKWEGELCEHPEQLLIIKTTRDHGDATIDRIRELHSYDLPEMLLLPVVGGYPPYLQWLCKEVRQ
jgi:periplasmic divalent cation tolerance protein